MKLFVLILFSFQTAFTFSQETRAFLIGSVVTIQFNEKTWTKISETQLNSDLENGIQTIWMRSPYIITVDVIKSYSDIITSNTIDIQLWFHEKPEFFLDLGKPYLFEVKTIDSATTYAVNEYQPVFRIISGKWAAPVKSRDRFLYDSRKAVFNYKTLQQNETKYYVLVKSKVLRSNP